MKKYEYHVIPNTSIEFIFYPHDDPLIAVIYSVLNEIDVPMLNLDLIWRYEELNKIENTKFGKIKIHKNLWGDIIIFAIENEKIIDIIDQLLQKHQLFIKID